MALLECSSALDLQLLLPRPLPAGTPTPSSGAATPVTYLQPLLAFLHDEPYGSQASAWQEAIQVGSGWGSG